MQARPLFKLRGCLAATMLLTLTQPGQYNEEINTLFFCRALSFYTYQVIT
uniref:Uncharacterized protein n=1 Tax=Anguilla anguilla TaxID=7936 RepID=A0A0E9UT52_ANGAN